MQRHDGGDGFHGASASEEVAGHGFGGVEADVEGVVAEHLFDGDDLGEVALRR